MLVVKSIKTGAIYGVFTVNSPQENDMTDKNTNSEKMDDVQMAAVAISATIIIFFVIYWSIQIQSVRDLLEMAYG